jgi:hypothetical protein
MGHPGYGGLTSRSFILFTLYYGDHIKEETDGKGIKHAWRKI